MIAAARIAAYETVMAVAAGRADLPAALHRARQTLKDERDRALCGEIATGTLRWQGAFDHVIAAFSGRTTAKLDPEILAILRISIFQLLHLDRVPAAAVVDDAVELARKAGKKSAAGFVNALLRRVSRERKSLPLPDSPAIELLSITLSHPRWLAERWLARHGADAAIAWAKFNNAPAPLMLRVNTVRASRDVLIEQLAEHGVVSERSRFAANGLLVTSGNPLLTPLAHQGLFFIQDEASQLVGEFVAARPGERLFDACASPGGKTTQMAATLNGVGIVVAADVRERRVALLRRTVRESGVTGVQVIQANARGTPPLRDVFDAVLVDAPCSGLGTVRRDPDVKWRRSEADLPALALAQAEMLAQLAGIVRPGGRLIYSTCSSEPEENEAIVASFLAAHPRFRRATPDHFAGTPQLAALLDADGALKTLPFRDGLEAFYAASLVREVAGT